MDEQPSARIILLVRGTLIFTGLLLLVLCVGFLYHWSWVIGIWPWSDGNLSYRFLGSIMAAIAMPVIWIGWSGELAAMRAGALDFALNYTGLGAMVWLFQEQVSTWVTFSWTLGFCILSALFNLSLYQWARRLLFKDTTPIPVLLRGAFLLFTLVLMAVGTALILCYPYVFPWPLQPQTSIVFGWVFMGASLFFLHGFIYAVRGNVRGQLLGFIAYDLILLIPFFEHIQKVTAERQLSLSVYLGVIIFSLGLSIYYLFMHPHTRFRWRHG
ncbi:hypothetical protein [Thiothrix fructosivorans]|uniref:Uncharacterized protein n=1 Tax=Thiothrix fructosivorans TaxID=111770 RepID=A0A8B0SNJ2_9GAMM|nr:hypothetical protein [Thiothrix fructosivorans]MBO0612397.1 hypothetical protein [Thiothrix fructosivorans]QTX12120.1 hypothetical protein J1836_007285 [Thiothrix fructosivorans]